MKNALFILGAGMLLASSCGVGGCGRQATPPPVVEARASPTPAPADDLFSRKDFDSDKLRAKADKAVASLGKYLDREDPKLRAKFEKLGNKLADRFGQDKDHWREKLQAKRHDLEPQIEKLKERLAREGGQAKDKLRDQLSDLQRQSDSTDQKLSKLEAIGADAWKQFRAHLRDDEAKEKTPPTDSDDEKAATPSPQS